MTGNLNGNLSMNRIQSSQFTKLLFGMGWSVTAITQGTAAMLIATSVLTSSPQMAIAGSCRTVAQHWDGYVDVRSAPRNRFNNLRTTVPNGTELEVIGEQGDWLEIYSPEPGWVAQSQTRRICSRDGRPRRANRDYDDYRDYDNYRD
jgi:hypothetical protein